MFYLCSHNPDQGPEDDEDEAKTETQQTNKLEIFLSVLWLLVVIITPNLLLSPALGGEVKVGGERDDDAGPVQDQPGDGEGSPPLAAGTWEVERVVWGKRVRSLL